MKNSFLSFLQWSLVLVGTILSAQAEKITFPAADGLVVTADLYRASEDLATPMIVLFHQAGFSRGEYLQIAPRLVGMGFNCLAVDQRSGNATAGVTNETAARAKSEGKATGFLDAVPDLEAAIAKAKSTYTNGAVIIWGSSYSSSLVIKLAGEQPAIANGVLAFSPGEYFSSESATLIRTAAAGVIVPTFITSAKNEASSWQAIFEAIPAEGKVSFLPTTGGRHGSSTLNANVAEREEYWTAVSGFLSQFQVTAPGTLKVQSTPMEGGQISLKFSGTIGSHYRISVSKDLKVWRELTNVTASAAEMTMVDEARIERNLLFYRVHTVDSVIEPKINSVSASGSPGAYSFSVGILSTETGDDQYANWWEVLDEAGNLLYRRVLGHPHIDEQPFVRSGGPVAITADQVVWVRAHMNRGGYGKATFKGSVSAGFEAAELSPVFGSEAAVSGNLP